MARLISARGLVALAAGTSLLLAGCATGPSLQDLGPIQAAPAGGVDLSGVCPETVVIQTDWNPQAEHGHSYQLLGPDYVVDSGAKTVTSDLYASGKPTGVRVQVRAGGPAIGFQPVTAQMYTDDTITLGYVETDQAMQFSASKPTTAVFSQFQKSPLMVMWDPATYPDVHSLAELGQAMQETGGVVRYFNGAPYMDFAVGSGLFSESQVDGSYDGAPASFVAAGGKDAQQGFATAEPYIYGKEIGAWRKPIDYQLLYDAGYRIYPQSMSVRTADLPKLTPCLTKLVPVLQQAAVDYANDPTPTNKVILDLVGQYQNSWSYSPELAAYSSAEMKRIGMFGNGPKGYAGEMDPKRVQGVIDELTPIFTAQNLAPKEGLQPSDLVTNKFLDKSIRY